MKNRISLKDFIASLPDEPTAKVKARVNKEKNKKKSKNLTIKIPTK